MIAYLNDAPPVRGKREHLADDLGILGNDDEPPRIVLRQHVAERDRPLDKEPLFPE
jgi:hypothetical protein